MTVQSSDEIDPLEIEVGGRALLTEPLLNKGLAFTVEERSAFGLHGLLPPHIETLEEQVERRLIAVRRLRTNAERYHFLSDLQDENETLFYALITSHLSEMLPIIYTPTVGQGCQEFSDYWRYPRGLFLSLPYKDRIAEILSHPRYDRVETIVVSDGERVLGLGDQGVGGMGIPVGKLALYTACGGLNPATTLPVFLDVGTDNQARLDDPLYIGWRHARVRGPEYDAFVESFVSALEERWPNVLLQWEDFARGQAGTLLNRYRDRLLTFNDDIQGTAAVAAGTLLAAMHVSGVAFKDQRIVIVGAGSAGCGIAKLILHQMVESGLSEAEARRRFHAVDIDGLLVEGMPGLLDFQQPFAQPREAVADWKRKGAGKITLEDVVANAKPTLMIGVSAQPGIFHEELVRTMAANVDRPVIMPLSNPTSRAEAMPKDLVEWTDGRVITCTGSPFTPVEYGGRLHVIDQTNNAYIFPGLGLGVLAVGARRVSDGMFAAAARALAAISPARKDPHASLLPPTDSLRDVAIAIAAAVAKRARDEGLCDAFEDDDLPLLLAKKQWRPVYRLYVKKPGYRRIPQRPDL
ncbi:NAD-dependent malic enzyme [Methyloligella halotolerans]|uniref:NAD-dependent malic enzyme n=1 Tax=Methyloligella halotolerans TaxID=1177755 RepID=A0A1E2RYJ9_9HYPH|nr:NAD-dependent malic enzyme [Methyloligella halotolerans]ODA67291.1 NAD-dependent malic enzyme [Methyloligella halotolerans]